MADTGFISWHGAGCESRTAFGDNIGPKVETLCWICDTEKSKTELGLCAYCERYVLRRK